MEYIVFINQHSKNSPDHVTPTAVSLV